MPRPRPAVPSRRTPASRFALVLTLVLPVLLAVPLSDPVARAWVDEGSGGPVGGPTDHADPPSGPPEGSGTEPTGAGEARPDGQELTITRSSGRGGDRAEPRPGTPTLEATAVLGQTTTVQVPGVPDVPSGSGVPGVPGGTSHDRDDPPPGDTIGPTQPLAPTTPPPGPTGLLPPVDTGNTGPWAEAPAALVAAAKRARAAGERLAAARQAVAQHPEGVAQERELIAAQRHRQAAAGALADLVAQAAPAVRPPDRLPQPATATPEPAATHEPAAAAAPTPGPAATPASTPTPPSLGPLGPDLNTEFKLAVIQVTLDVLGLAEVFGPAPDALNLVLSAAQGDPLGAGLTAVGMVPIFGEGSEWADLQRRLPRALALASMIVGTTRSASLAVDGYGAEPGPLPTGTPGPEAVPAPTAEPSGTP